MASLYHPRYPTGKDSPYWNIRCYRKDIKKKHYVRLIYPDGRRVKNERDATRMCRDHEVDCPYQTNGSHGKTVITGMRDYLEATKEERGDAEQHKLEQRISRLNPLPVTSESYTGPFGNLPLHLLTNDVIQQVLNQLMHEPSKGHGHQHARLISKVTRDHYLRLIRQCCRWWFMFKGWIQQDVSQGLHAIGRSPSAVFLPESEWDSFLALAKDDAYEAGTATALMTGLRGKSELTRMIAQDFLLNQHVIRVRAEISKNGKENYLPIMDDLLPILRRVLRGRKPYEVVFPYSYWQWEKKVSRWLRKLGYRGRLGLHTLRHSFCTWAYTRFGEYKGMELTRHSSLEMARRYTHLRRMPVKPEHMTRRSEILLGDTLADSPTRNHT